MLPFKYLLNFTISLKEIILTPVKSHLRVGLASPKGTRQTSKGKTMGKTCD